MADQKISELTALTGNPTGTDISVLVRGGVDYKYTFTQLIGYIAANLTTGSVVTFSNDTPSNANGKNGDVVIKPASGEFWQKVAGTWVLQYTITEGVVGSKIYYGTSAPNNATGIDGDTFLQTDGGLFYLKVSGAWVLKFSMASGPAGATGADGAPGTNGTNGNTIISGTTPPSNDIGVNGDYFINYNTLYIYGPKAAGVWPDGRSIINNAPGFKQAYNYNVSDARFSYDSLSMELTFTLNSDDQILFPYDAINGILTASIRQKYSDTKYKQRNSFDPTITDDGSKYISVLFEGVDSDMITNCQIILY